MRTITLAYLKKKDACDKQMKLFKTTFGKAVDLTRDNLICAAKIGLNLDWLIEQAEFHSAYEKYNVIERPVQEQLQIARRLARKKYNAGMFPVVKQFEAAKRSAFEQYDGNQLSTAMRSAIAQYNVFEKPLGNQLKASFYLAKEQYKTVACRALVDALAID